MNSKLVEEGKGESIPDINFLSFFVYPLITPFQLSMIRPLPIKYMRRPNPAQVRKSETIPQRSLTHIMHKVNKSFPQLYCSAGATSSSSSSLSSLLHLSSWYFESMTIMRWNNRRGFIGYMLKEICNMTSSGQSIGIYRGLVDVTNYLVYLPVTRAPYSQQALQVNV